MRGDRDGITDLAPASVYFFSVVQTEVHLHLHWGLPYLVFGEELCEHQRALLSLNRGEKEEEREREGKGKEGRGRGGGRTMFGIPFEIGYTCAQFGHTIAPSSTWICACVERGSSARAHPHTGRGEKGREAAHLEQDVVQLLQELVV